MAGARELLDQPVEVGARIVALPLLAAAVKASHRLADHDDAEALHDFRVAVRRLRSCLRAYRPHLGGSVPKPCRRTLRELAAATGQGRDSEVQLEWLRRQKLEPRQRAGRAWLLARLEQHLESAWERIRRDVAAELPDVAGRLERSLSVYRVPVHRHSHAPTFARSTSEILAAVTAELQQHFDLIASADDEVVAHRARISSKRLRYLIEPLVEHVPGCAALLTRLKTLQELLGDLHDAAVLGAELRTAVETAAAERALRLVEVAEKSVPGKARGRAPAAGPDPGIGLLALVRSVRRHRERKFSELERDWLGARSRPFFDDLGRLAGALAAPAD